MAYLCQCYTMCLSLCFWCNGYCDRHSCCRVIAPSQWFHIIINSFSLLRYSPFNHVYSVFSPYIGIGVKRRRNNNHIGLTFTVSADVSKFVLLLSECLDRGNGPIKRISIIMHQLSPFQLSPSAPPWFHHQHLGEEKMDTTYLI